MPLTSPRRSLERRLIKETHGDDWMLANQIWHLSRFPAMRPRMTLLHQARVDYQDGRYYALVLTLIAVRRSRLESMNLSTSFTATASCTAT